MPSYADEMAARHPSPTATRGPVRLWISRGEVKRDARGREYVEEIWEEEEIMDTDIIDSSDQGEFSQLANASYINNGLMNENITSSLSSLIGQNGALLVLDTNVLIDALPFFVSIFTQCLARNTHALSMGTFTLSPLSLILPEVVISELDNLKTRTHTREKAQRANHWILDAVLQQKKRSYIISVQSHNEPSRSEKIPERAWALHIENHQNHLKSQNDPIYKDASPDDEIVSLCRILQRDTGQTAWLCTNDINAQLRAESEGINTFSPSKWIREEIGQLTEGRDEKLSNAVSEMIDQWSSQICLEHAALSGHSSRPADLMSDIAHDPAQQKAFLESQRAISQGVSDSIHAVRSTRSQFNQNQMHIPRRSERLQNGSRTSTQSGSNTYIYSPNDRSSSSSMWASRRY